MFFFGHVAAAVVAAGFLFFFDRGCRSFWGDFFWLVGVQFIDLDHFAGSWVGLVKAGFCVDMVCFREFVSVLGSGCVP